MTSPTTPDPPTDRHQAAVRVSNEVLRALARGELAPHDVTRWARRVAARLRADARREQPPPIPFVRPLDSPLS